MPNPFYQNQGRNINPANKNMNNFKSIYQALMSSKNPVQLFNTMAQNNPQLKPIANMLNQGMNPQSIFTTMCEQRGINPNEFIKQLQG